MRIVREFGASRRGLCWILPAILCLLLVTGAAHAQGTAQADCRIDEGPCTVTVRSFHMTFALEPRPVKTMRELLFAVTVREKETPVDDASVSVNLTMPGMTMGVNTVMLENKGRGVYEGKSVIVRCPSGKKIWKATIAVRRGGKTVSAPFVFEVR